MKFFTLVLLFFVATFSAMAQTSCPANMNFALGDFTYWQCSIGNNITPDCTSPFTFTATPTTPIAGRHTILPPNQNVDPFGGFPITPQGVTNVARLGLVGQYGSPMIAGSQVEKLSYTFTVPASASQYSISFLFAIVYHEPNHCAGGQPFFGARLFDSTTNQYINCLSIDHFAIAGSSGFVTSPNTSMGYVVSYLPWTPYTAILDGYAGHTLRLEFTNSDCSTGGHWAYSYLAIPNNIGCSSSTQGNVFCAGTNSTLVGPSGYQSYNWWNSNFTQLIGTGQVLPIPSTQTTPATYALDLVSYAGTACRDTVMVNVQPNTTTLQASAGPDKMICGGATSVTIGTPAVPGLVYSWLPAPTIAPADPAQPVVQPSATTTYVMTATDPTTGCVKKDTVIVAVNAAPAATISLAGNVLTSSAPAGNQWYLNGTAIAGATGTTYTATTPGNYTVIVTVSGCTSPVSNTVTYSVTGIDVIMAEWKLQIAPNPANDKLVITYGGAQKLDLEVLDLTGRLLFSNKNISSNFTVNMSKYLKGAYLVKLTNSKTNREVKKLIVKM